MSITGYGSMNVPICLGVPAGRSCRVDHLVIIPPLCRNMVYNWDGKEAECYRLYVHERRSLQEVVDYWEEQGFTPRYVTARLSIRRAVLFATSARHVSHMPSC